MALFSNLLLIKALDKSNYDHQVCMLSSTEVWPSAKLFVDWTVHREAFLKFVICFRRCSEGASTVSPGNFQTCLEFIWAHRSRDHEKRAPKNFSAIIASRKLLSLWIVILKLQNLNSLSDKSWIITQFWRHNEFVNQCFCVTKNHMEFEHDYLKNDRISLNVRWMTNMESFGNKFSVKNEERSWALLSPLST